MPTLKYTLVDAFTKVPFYGNPCNVVFGADRLDKSTRLAITRTFNLSETAFLVSSSKADFGVRYYTHSDEIPLAGHPTIATVLALLDSGSIAFNSQSYSLTLEMGAGVVDIEVSSDGEYSFVTMYQLPPVFMSTHNADVVMPLFGLAKEDLLENAPIQTVSTGTPQLMVPVKSLEVLKRLRLQMKEYSEYLEKSDFMGGPHVFTVNGVTSTGSTFARHPCSPPNGSEDPFTGSSTGGMAAYLWKYGLLDKPRFRAEQGYWMNKQCSADVEIEGVAGNPKLVKVRGTGRILARGELNC